MDTSTASGHVASPFLATTALCDFWNTSGPVVFLGGWCKRYGSRADWAAVDGVVMTSPWKNRAVVDAAYRYVADVCARVLPVLGQALNEIHGEERGERYWRVIVGPWLILYVAVMYDRYMHLRRALDQYPDLSTVLLSEESFVAPLDTIDFVYYLQEDSYNLQLFSRILMAMGRRFPSKHADTDGARRGAGGRQSWKARLRRAAAGIVDAAARAVRRRDSILLKHSYFPRMVELRLAVKTGGILLPAGGRGSAPTAPARIIEIRKDLRARLDLRARFAANDEFETLLSHVLALDLPVSFVEAFDSLGKEAEAAYPTEPAAIFSANAWYYDEPFKRWAAVSMERGAVLLGAQHGGIYGGETVMPSEDHETAITDYYYSWGWERSDCTAKVIPLPASKLVNRKVIGADNRKHGIFWALTSTSRYLFQFPYVPDYFETYLSWQIRFASLLAPGMVAVIKVRPHYADYGWDIAQRLLDRFPSMPIETWKVPFLKSLKQCRLYICDHFSTTFAESLAANKPTILFWNPDTNRLRPEAQLYYDQLRAAGILFDTPESAAAAVNIVYHDVEAWWNQDSRQTAVRAYCNRFARVSPNAIDEWAGEFARIAGLAAAKRRHGKQPTC